jgi:hypothetical protein
MSDSFVADIASQMGALADSDKAAFEEIFGAEAAETADENVEELARQYSDQLQSTDADLEQAQAARRLEKLRNRVQDLRDSEYANNKELNNLIDSTKSKTSTIVLNDPSKQFELLKLNSDDERFANTTYDDICKLKDKQLSLEVVRAWGSGSLEENEALVRMMSEDMKTSAQAELRLYARWSTTGEVDLYDVVDDARSTVSKSTGEELKETNITRSFNNWMSFLVNDVGLLVFPFINMYMMYRMGSGPQFTSPAAATGVWTLEPLGGGTPPPLLNMCMPRQQGEVLDLATSDDPTPPVVPPTEYNPHADPPTASGAACMAYCDTTPTCHMAQFQSGKCYVLEYDNTILTGSQLRKMFAPSSAAATTTGSVTMFKCDDMVEWRKYQLSQGYGCFDTKLGTVVDSLNCAVSPTAPTEAQQRTSCYWPSECPADSLYPNSPPCAWDNCPAMDACKRACEFKNEGSSPSTARYVWKDRLGAARIMTSVGCYDNNDIREEDLYYKPNENMSTANIANEDGKWEFVPSANMGKCIGGVDGSTNVTDNGCEIDPRSDYNYRVFCDKNSGKYRWMEATNLMKLTGCYRYINEDAAFNISATATPRPMKRPLMDSDLVLTGDDETSCLNKNYLWFGPPPASTKGDIPHCIDIPTSTCKDAYVSSKGRPIPWWVYVWGICCGVMLCVLVVFMLRRKL